MLISVKDFGNDLIHPNWHHPSAVHNAIWAPHNTALLIFVNICNPTCSVVDIATFTTSNKDSACLFVCVLTLSLYFICAPSPDNSPGLQLDLKGPSLWPLGLLRIKQCQYCAQLQVSVQVVHLSVVVHPRNGPVGKEAWGPSHVHFPCLLSVSSQNNLLGPGLDRDTYSRRRRGKTMKLPQGPCVCQCCTHITGHRKADAVGRHML